MSYQDEEDKRMYRVVVNQEEQQSIWFVDREPPMGWKVTDKQGTRTECLGFIQASWTDMTPASLRN